MDSTYFTICVPTRNRTETLFYCLKSLLDQEFQSYEIILSDNSDDEESNRTIKIVEEFGSDKIKYFKTEKLLSMTENYEFALSKANGKYILCIGDDDGLIVNSLNYVFDFIKKYNAKVIKCPRVGYGWIGSFWNANSIMAYPLERPVIKIDSRSMLEKVANFQMRYSDLPMIYYSFVDRQIVDEVVKEKGSFFQNSASIDMYSGFVIAYKTPEYYVTDKPFVIMGSSNKSNGALGMVNPNHSIVKEYLESHNMVGYYEKYKIPIFQKLVLSNFVWLEILKFMENYGLDKTYLTINHKNILINMVSTEAIFENITTLGMAEAFEQYPLYHSDVSNIKRDFLDKEVYFPNYNNEESEFCQHVLVDPRLFGVKDVYDASLLCRRFLDCKEKMIPLKISKELLGNLRKENSLNKTESFLSLAKKMVKKIIS